MKNLSKIYSHFLKNSKEYREIMKIVKLNNKGKSWLIGGFVYRNLANLLYKTPVKKDSDIDVIMENQPKKFRSMKSWKINRNFFGNPKFVNGSNRLDLIPLASIYHFKTQNIKPTIKNYLKVTRYSVESIAFDIQNKKLIGPIGIKSLLERKIAINNLTSAKLSFHHRNVSVKKLLLEKAKSLNFEIVKKL